MKVTCILPVYNEGKTVGNVLKVLVNSKMLDNILIINDGSKDNSAKEVKKFKSKKIKFVNLKKNMGKGNAIREGIKGLKTDIVFMCDADLIRFKEQNINEIINPVIKGQVEMCMGIKDNPVRGFTFIYYVFQLAGERAMKYKDFKKIMSNPLIEGWGIESVINRYYKDRKLKVRQVGMKGVTHILRAKKEGLSSLISECIHVAKTQAKMMFSKNHRT
ncbi:MAG: glycosyltransferase [Candidatus Woesearchaeota archaeon]|jgi:glycosyltransferase involved in cell wall biosynthesis|nr:glycosyltransferase [Candidatus Woesearchaeota archaeon]MDP7180709.1 glycosyltransferase [Candidatus Woesearchaeota archaeon]